MEIKFDTYSFRARVLPVYVTLAPIVLLLAAVVPEGLKLPISGAAALVFAPISFLLSQVGADFGKRLEKGLWTNWGGPPTTRFLRHGNSEFNEVTRDRIHAKLRQLGLRIPTHEEQMQDPCSSDTYYESCTDSYPDQVIQARLAEALPVLAERCPTGMRAWDCLRNA